MGTVRVRYARPDEFPAIANLDGASFGFVYTPDQLEDALLDVDPQAMLVADDGGRIVGASCEVPAAMTLPGGRAVPTLGLTWVSVEVTHRRRGILRRLIEQQLRDGAARGLPVSILTASESGIYGRYGFGIATQSRRTVINRRAARLAGPIGDHGVTRRDTDEVRDVLPGLYDRWRAGTPGALERDAKRWQLQLLDRDWQRHGRSALFHLVHADGYVSYRVGHGEGPTGTDNTASLVDYVICSAEAHRSLWQVLLAMDLVASIETNRIPLDDPLPYLLTDPRQVTTTSLIDGLWVRPLDVVALLSARTYAVDLDVTLAVRDPLLGDGTYRLRAGDGGAVCERTDATPDVRLDVGDLGAIVLGGTRVATLARAGRIVGDPAVLTRLDRAFLAEVSPQFGTYF